MSEINWNLPVNIKLKSTFKPIGYNDKLILFGSCFSENIGALLVKYKFQSVNNPFGILYNPSSIAKAISRIINQQYYSKEELCYANERWLSFDHHSSFSSGSRETVIHKINQAIDRSNDWLKKAHTIIVTFGTAYYYTLNESNEVVGNCHKIPSNNFNRLKLSIEDIIFSYQSLIKLVEKINPDMQWMFTVSPVRHWKDGAVNNNWSKSTLICAVNDLVQSHDAVHYFPSYEIMMDELRDHRFYNEDMLHPSTQAIQHIWSRFLNTAIEASSLKLLNHVNDVVKACSHRPFNYQSIQHQAFIQKTLDRIQNLKSKHPQLDFSKEEEELRAQKVLNSKG